MGLSSKGMKNKNKNRWQDGLDPYYGLQQKEGADLVLNVNTQIYKKKLTIEKVKCDFSHLC